MNKSNVVEFSSRDAIVDPLSELLREMDPISWTANRT